jgi:hypothetical protein
MHEKWCGEPCGKCKKNCTLDESIPCSPDCKMLDYNGNPKNLRNCLESDCDAIICVEKIQDAVAEDLKAYREKIIDMSSSEVYAKAHDIHLVEEITYLICDYPEDYEDDTDIVWALYNLSLEGKFLDEFLEWSSNMNSIDVSNTEKACDTLKNFCDYLSEESE